MSSVSAQRFLATINYRTIFLRFTYQKLFTELVTRNFLNLYTTYPNLSAFALIPTLLVHELVDDRVDRGLGIGLTIDHLRHGDGSRFLDHFRCVRLLQQLRRGGDLLQQFVLREVGIRRGEGDRVGRRLGGGRRCRMVRRTGFVGVFAAGGGHRRHHGVRSAVVVVGGVGCGELHLL